MESRNARHTAHGTIDCEINHPVYGWIPTTLSPDDPETRELFAVVKAGNVTAYTSPVRVLSQVKTEKLAGLAALRYEKETSGVTVGAANIMTDRGSQAMITGAYVAAQIDPLRLIDFKVATGWVQIDAATVFAIAAAVSSHVQSRFSIERGHAESIAALTIIADVDGYDIAVGW